MVLNYNKFLNETTWRHTPRPNNYFGYKETEKFINAVNEITNKILNNNL